MKVRVRQRDVALPLSLLEIQLQHWGSGFLVTIWSRGDDHMMHVKEIPEAWPHPRAALERILEEGHGFSHETALKGSTLLFDRLEAASARAEPSAATS